jgi:hypothetical protein
MNYMHNTLSTAYWSLSMRKREISAEFDKMMVFGCSNILNGHIHDEPTSDLPAGKFIVEDSWNDQLARTLGLTLDNHGRAGSANYWIYQRVIQALDTITDKTLVIVQWSYESRAVARGDDIKPIHVNLDHKHSRSYYDNFYIEDQEISKMLGYTLLLSKMIPNLYFDFCNGSDHLREHSPEAFHSVAQLPGYLGLFGRPFHCHSIFDQSNRYECSHLNASGRAQLAKLYTFALSRRFILPT